MKKITLIIVTFLLMISVFAGVIYADEENGEPVAENTEVTETTPPEETTPNEIIKEECIEVKAEVIEAGAVKEVENGSIKDTVQEIKLEILEGEYDTQEFLVNYVLSYDIDGKILAYELEEGDVVWVQITKSPDGNVSVAIENIVRENYIYVMLFLFLLSIVLIGGKQGVKAILGLIVTILAVYFILIKGIFKGYDPIWMSVFTTFIIIILTFLIIGNGINKKIITAALGTFGGVLAAGVMATIFSHLLKLSGACEDAIQLSANAKNLNFNFRDLLFAGIVISALGACMDVGMSIASSLDELRSKTKDMDWKDLFKSGMNIGRDVIGTMANTLILAYVGGALTVILLFLACDFSFVQILNKETIAEEVISAVAGSMGVVYTVPITAFIYSFLNRNKTVYKTTSENKVEGNRSLKI